MSVLVHFAGGFAQFGGKKRGQKKERTVTVRSEGSYCAGHCVQRARKVSYAQL